MASGTDGTSHATRATGLPITDGSSPCSSCCDDPSVASDPRSRHERIVTRARSARTIPAPRHLQACSNCRQHGSAFGACCCAGKLRSPAPPTVRTTSPALTRAPRRVRQTLRRTLRQTIRRTLRTRPAYPALPSALVLPQARAPKGGQSPAKTAGDWPPLGERCERAERCFARLIHRRGRVLGGP